MFNDAQWSDQQGHHQKRKGSRGTTPRPRRGKLLLVEDHADTREAFSTLAVVLGYAIRTADRSAGYGCRGGPISGVLTGLAMP